MISFIFEKAMHAVLYKRYDPKVNKLVKVGDSQGTYAPEDKNTRAEYHCLGLGKKGTKVLYSSDLKCGPFYSENVFLMGEDNDGEILSFESLEEFNRKVWGIGTQRALLPKGYVKGNQTWHNALYYIPVERQPYWDSFEKRIQFIFPNYQIYKHDDRFIEVYFD